MSQILIGWLNKKKAANVTLNDFAFKMQISFAFLWNLWDSKVASPQEIHSFRGLARFYLEAIKNGKTSSV